tara:strand:- start:1070 stop:1306 length:237 start_codon:yes stop_codon:yes gene_type:complete
MVYPSKSIPDCKGRAHPRPVQLERMTAEEQAEYFKEFAETSCKYCFGSGGVLEFEYEERGYYQVPHEYFEPCDCIDKE